MTKPEQPSDPPKVKCHVCLKEIPVSEAKSAEAVSYVHHFCGLECFDKWKAQENG